MTGVMYTREPQRPVLIIDKDVAGMEPLRQRLCESGFQVRVITELHAAIAAMCMQPPQLLMLDWDVPGIAAHQVVKNIRALPLPPTTRLIIASALGGEEQIVTALTLGADDFISKPFSLREAVARVSGLLRTDSPARVGSRQQLAALELDSAARRICVRGVSLELRRIECRLLEFLMVHNGHLFSRQQLMNQVWGDDAVVDERTVDVNVQRLRKLLAAQGYEGRIQTVRGFGYRFMVPNVLPRGEQRDEWSGST